jgi:NarL family two-component system response regulator LiaR
MTTEPIHVLLVDDHAVVRHGLGAFLATYPEITVVGEASSGAAVLYLLPTTL